MHKKTPGTAWHESAARTRARALYCVGVAGFLGVHACGEVFGDLLVEMKLDFVV